MMPKPPNISWSELALLRGDQCEFLRRWGLVLIVVVLSPLAPQQGVRRPIWKAKEHNTESSRELIDFWPKDKKQCGTSSSVTQ